MLNVVITGGLGNLGSKLSNYFYDQCQHTISHITVIDIHQQQELHFADAGGHQLDSPAKNAINNTKRRKFVQADLRFGGVWERELEGVDVVLHFAAQNAYPDGSWQDSGFSMDINNTVFAACKKYEVKRILFASSNHVMGGYLQQGVSVDSASVITSDLPPLVGTKFAVGNYQVDSTPYAAAKLMGERAGLHIASTTPAQVICVRIGWCQPAENTPHTLNPFGKPAHMVHPKSENESANKDPAETPTQITTDEQIIQNNLTSWFRNMWLSNADLTHLFYCLTVNEWPNDVVFPSSADNPTAQNIRYTILYGMSDNTGARWDLGPARQWFGYRPVNDVNRELGLLCQSNSKQ